MKMLFNIYAVLCGVAFAVTTALWFLNPEFNKSAANLKAEEEEALHLLDSNGGACLAVPLAMCVLY
jgi:hypothetical protein